MAKLVSTTYGDALFELAVENQQMDAMYEEVKAVSEAIRENHELALLMNHPKIDKEEKIRFIEEAFDGRVSRELVGLMRLIVEKDHFSQMDSVFTYFINRVKEYRNIGTVLVTGAFPLTDAQKAAVEKRLLETTKYVQLEMHYETDPSLIGGMKIRIGDRIVDSSVKNKLQNLTRELQKVTVVTNE